MDRSPPIPASSRRRDPQPRGSGTSPSRRAPRLTTRHHALREQRQQRRMVDRLDQVVVDARFTGPLSVLQPSVTRDGDEDGILAGRFLPEPYGDLITIHAGQAEVEEDELRSLT